MNEKYSNSPQPFAITTINPWTVHGCCPWRENTPDIRRSYGMIKKLDQSTSDGSERISTSFPAVIASDVAMKGKKILKGYQWRTCANERSVAYKTPVSAFGVPVSISFSGSTAKNTADSIGRTDKTFFIDTLLADIWEIVKV